MTPAMKGLAAASSSSHSVSDSGLARLDGDRAVDPLPPDQRLEIAGQEVALEDAHAFVDPRIFARVVAPEMLMSVDVHAGPQGSGIGVPPAALDV